MGGETTSNRCLLLIDLFNHFQFDDGKELAQALVNIVPTLAAAIGRARNAKIPIIYCNDNFGRWHETWKEVFAFTEREGLPESTMLFEQLSPQPGDIVLLKSRHSAFFETQLPSVLNDLHVRSMAIAGAATDACVLCTAIDAHVRGLRVTVLEDAVAAASRMRQQRALDEMKEGLGLRVCSYACWLVEHELPASSR
jgi:nicotinamidase-related amidase